MESRKGDWTLAGMLDEVASGRFPPTDGGVTIIPPPSQRDAGVLGFTAHAVIFIDADPAWVTGQLPGGDLTGPLSPAFLHALCDHTGRNAHTINILCVAPALHGPPPIALTSDPGLDHPRLARALRYRDSVQAWRADGGVVAIGRGIAGRWEVSIEVDSSRRGAGLGRALARAARRLVPAGAPLWAQAAPANVASVRSLLSAGFRPAGAEAHLTPIGRVHGGDGAAAGGLEPGVAVRAAQAQHSLVPMPGVAVCATLAGAS
jgi:GNAT superfamily N-acetyltransferase